MSNSKQSKYNPPHQVIIVGGGLAGMSAAHTVLERGGRVVLVEKMALCGGNSTKATSGINGALTKTQITNGINDSPEIFENDTMKGGAERPDLVKVLTHQSAPAVEWLMDKFDLDLSLVSRLGGHSHPRTHRGKTKFPGMTITYALMEKFEELSEKYPDRAQLLPKCKATKLLTSTNKKIIGVEYLNLVTNTMSTIIGPVILATGGYAHDFTPTSLILKHRPDLAHLPTTNGEFATGDGIKMALDAGCECVDLEWVQVHPTGLVHPDEPGAKIKFLAAEALRGVGGLILDKNGKRFCNELGRRDYVTGEMWKHNQHPYRLVLNSRAAKEIEWHCKHYKGRGLMKEFSNANELCKDMNILPSTLFNTFEAHNKLGSQQDKNPEGGPYDAYPSGKSYDPYGKKFFSNLPCIMDDSYFVAIITPVLHYCMGGLKVDVNGKVGGCSGGLYGAGEVNGGIHGKNRLGGNSLLDCVVFGRVSGSSAAKELLEENIQHVGNISRM